MTAPGRAPRGEAGRRRTTQVLPTVLRKEGVIISERMEHTRRRRVTHDKPQQVTRIPPYRPGMWVKIKHFESREPGSDLSGKVRRVKSLTCSITSPDQKYAVWRVHFEDGRCLEWHMIERPATEAEIQTALSRMV